jgi:hypothetical protein
VKVNIRIPNKEVNTIWNQWLKSMIVSAIREHVKQQMAKKLVQFLIAGKNDAIRSCLDQAFSRLSYFDMETPPESVYQLVILGLLGMDKSTKMKWKWYRDSGKAHAHVIGQSGLLAIIIEVKVRRNDGQRLAELAEEALDELKEKVDFDDLHANVESMWQYGIGCSGKACNVKARKIARGRDDGSFDVERRNVHAECSLPLYFHFRTRKHTCCPPSFPCKIIQDQAGDIDGEVNFRPPKEAHS